MSTRRLMLLVTSFIMVMCFIINPKSGLASPAAVSEIITAPVVETLSEVFLALVLPDRQALTVSPLTEEALLQAFHAQIAGLIPTLQEAIGQKQLRAFRIDEQRFGIILEDAQAHLLEKLTRMGGIETIITQITTTSAIKSLERRSTEVAALTQDMRNQSTGVAPSDAKNSRQNLPIKTTQPQPVQAAQPQLPEPPMPTRAPSAPVSALFPSLTPGHFGVNMPWNYIYGYTTVPSVNVTVNIKDGNIILASGSGISDDVNYYSVDVYTSQGRYYYIKPGDTVEVIETGGVTYSWILPSFTARMSFSTTTISGNAPTNAPISLNIGLSTGTQQVETTTAGDGSYSFSFPGAQFLRSYGNTLTVFDPISQNQFSRYLEIYLQAGMNGRNGCSYLGSVGFTTQSATFNVLSATRVLEATLTTTTDHIGWTCPTFSGSVILPGKIYQMVTPSGDMLEMTIPNLNVSANADTNIVSGTAPDSQQVSLAIYSNKSNKWYNRTLVADSGGSFSTDCSAETDLIGGDYVEATYCDAQNNCATYRFSLPHFKVRITHSHVLGYDFSAFTEITINLKNSSSELRATWLVETDSLGDFSLFLKSSDYLIPQLGDIVEVIPAGGSAITEIIPDLTIVGDTTAGTISGMAIPNNPIWVGICRETLLDHLCDGHNVTATGAGDYLATASPAWGVHPGDWIMMEPTTNAGNIFQIIEYLPNNLNVQIYDRSAEVNTSPDISVTLRVLTSSEVVKSTSTQLSGSGGGAYFTDLPGMIAGDIVEATSGGVITRLTVPTLSASANLVTNIVSGVAPALKQVGISVYSTKNQRWYNRTVTADGNGNFSTNFSAEVDLVGGDYGDAIIIDPQSNKAKYRFNISSFEVRILEGYIWGNGFSASKDVTINLKNSSGGLRGTWLVKTDSTGYFTRSFYTTTYLIPQVGDIVEVIPEGGATMTEIVPVLTMSANTSAGTISGKAIPNNQVWVAICREMVTNNKCESQFVTATGDGDYLVTAPAGWGVRRGDQIRVETTTNAGNTFQNNEYLPNRMIVDSYNRNATVYTSPGISVVLRVLNSSEVVKSTSTRTSDNYGYTSFSNLGELNSGDIVEAVSGGVTTRLTIVPISVTRVDRQANQFSGTAPAGETVKFVVRPSTSSTYSPYSSITTIAGTGTFNVDTTGAYDFTGSQYVGVIFFDANNNQLQHLVQVPYINVYRPSLTISGYTNRNGAVVALGLQGSTLLKTCVTQATADGWWSCGFSSDIDKVEVITFGATFVVPLPPLSMDVNDDTDVIWGTGPASTLIYASASGMASNSSKSMISQADGSFSFSFMPGYDIKHLNTARAYLYSAETDYFAFEKHIHGVLAYETSDQVSGYAQPLSAVNLSLRNGSTVKATATLNAASNGYFSTTGFCTSDTRADILPTDTLEALPTSAVTLPVVTGQIDTSADMINGTAPNNAILRVYALRTTNFLWSGFVTASASGTYSVNLSGQVDLIKGDYITVTWEDADGDQSFFVFSTTPQTSLSVAWSSVPSGARPNAPVSLEWQVAGGVGVRTRIRFDTVSHACDKNYRYVSATMNGTSGKFTQYITALPSGSLYVSAYSEVDGLQVWSPEAVIPISELEPVISDPVNGDTNTPTPILTGFAAPNALIEFYEGEPGVGTPILLGSTTVASSGYYNFTLPSPLSTGDHSIFGKEGSHFTNVVHLTVNTALPVDPNHIFFREGSGTAFRIRDTQGYARLGGRIWTRPNTTLNVSIPVACSTATSVSVTAGASTTELTHTGSGIWGEIWSGDFVHPNESFAVTANITCGTDPVQHALLTSGIIDPDGFVTNSKTGAAIPGTEVILKSKNAEGIFVDWDAASFLQTNPQVTDANGFYRFYVPPGEYKLEVKKYRFLPYLSNTITVVDAPIRVNVSLDPWSINFLPVVTR